MRQIQENRGLQAFVLEDQEKISTGGCSSQEEKIANDSDVMELKKLKEKIIIFREEEIQHREIGYENKAADLAIFKPLSRFIKGATKFAIAVSKKI